MSTLKEYIEKIEILKNEITGCDNLVEFYQKKRIELIKELDKMERMEINNA